MSFNVSVIIPALNQAANIGAVLAIIPRPVVLEILLVDGDSTDGAVQATYFILRTILRYSKP